MERCFCQVFRSKRHDGMYLFVEKQEGLARVPASLLAEFGRPEPSISFLLTPERALARAEPKMVLAAIAHTGFYLHMPPSKEARALGLDAYRAPTEGRY